MSLRLLRKGSISISFCLVHILFMCLWLITHITFIHARPILHDVDATKEYFKNSTNTPMLLGGDETFFPSEIQKAVCTVTAGDVKASAEAVTTKELKGVCRSEEINTAFSNLELKLIKELETIKSILTSLSQEKGYNNGGNTSLHAPKKPTVQFQPIPVDSKYLHNSNEVSKGQLPQPSFSPTKLANADQMSTASLRGREVLVYNNTLLSVKNLRVFTYFWKIENFTQNIKSGIGITVESPAFSIKGKAFKLKASFKHLHRDFLFLQLEDAKSLAKSGNSISLETGGLFKEIQNNSFKYKISVLHQNAQSKKDLVSQDFDNHESGFLIPNSALLDSPFVKDNAVLIQISLYV